MMKMPAIMVGQSAEALARIAGFVIPAGTRILVAERHYVNGRDTFVRELLSPVLAYYVEPDWRHGRHQKAGVR